MLIHFVRHTTPDVDVGVCYGRTDLDVAASFSNEVINVQSKLLKQYDAVYSSPLKRCSKLAEQIQPSGIKFDDRLLEYNFGDWEMTPWDTFTSPEAQQWMDNFTNQAAPNGESMLDMQSRVSDFWHELSQKSLKSVAVVSHSGVMRLIHGLILNTPLTHTFRLQLDYAAILEVNFDPNSGHISIKHL